MAIKRNRARPTNEGKPFLARNIQPRWILFSTAAVFAVWFAWALFIMLQANGLNVFIHLGLSPHFSMDANEFGDAFGSLSALMTTLAAGGALVTLYIQGRSQSTQLFEDSFYNLLGQFRQTISEAKLHQFEGELREDGQEYIVLSRTYEGREVFEFILGELTEAVENLPRPWNLAQLSDAYNVVLANNFANLSMYFRTSYHVFKTVDDVCPDQPYFYARIARAQLSNAELILIAYNCIFGEGAKFYIKYLEKFALMNNIFFTDDYKVHASPILRSLNRKCFGDSWRTLEADA